MANSENAAVLKIGAMVMERGIRSLQVCVCGAPRQDHFNLFRGCLIGPCEAFCSPTDSLNFPWVHPLCEVDVAAVLEPSAACSPGRF